MSEPALPELEKALPELREAYEGATASFLDLAKKKTKAAEKGRIPALHAWHSAGTALFNAHDRLIAVGSVTKADKNPTWYTDRVETSVNLLQLICNHYRTLWQWADDLAMPRVDFRPSPTAFANLQRIVLDTHPEIARALRDEFVGLGLPTHGFDTSELVKSSAPDSAELWERIIAVAAAVVGFGLAIYVVLRNEPFADPNQVVILRGVVSFSLAVFGATIPGVIQVRIGWQRNSLRACGGLALFVVPYFYTPEVLPPNPKPEPAKTSARPVEDIDIVDVGFADHPGEARAPRLDIKLANRGSGPAFIKNVKIKVKQTWQLPHYTTVGVVVPPSHEYVARLKPVGAPYEETLRVSHGLKPDEMDRFTVQLEENPWPSSNTIYRADVEIVANGSDLMYRKEDLLFLVTQAGTGFPRRADVEEMVRAQRSLGNMIVAADVERTCLAAKVMILEAARIHGVKSHSLQSLIQTATASDLG